MSTTFKRRSVYGSHHCSGGMDADQSCGGDTTDLQLAREGLLLRRKYNNVALRLHNRTVKRKLQRRPLTLDDCATVDVVTTTTAAGVAKSEAYEQIARVPLLSAEFLKNMKTAAPKQSSVLMGLAKEVEANEVGFTDTVDQHLAEVKDPIPIKTKKPYRMVYFRTLDL